MLSPVSVWRKNKQEFRVLGLSGRVVSWTVIHSASVYPVALVRMSDGRQIMGQIVAGPKNIVIGAQVAPVVRIIRKQDPDGIIEYGIKFRLI